MYKASSFWEEEQLIILQLLHNVRIINRIISDPISLKLSSFLKI